MSHIHPKWQLCLRLNLWKNRICWGRAGVHLPAISAKQESLGRYEHCTSARTIPPRIQKKWLTKKTSVYAVWSVTGKIIVLAMYKSTFQGKIADLGMVLDSVRVSGWIRWEILALVVRQLVRKSLCFLSLLPSLCSSYSTFALFFFISTSCGKDWRLLCSCSAHRLPGHFMTCFLFYLALFHSFYYCTAL